MRSVSHLCGLICGLILFTGCIKSSFQPIPPLYMLWKKPGATQLEVKMALLECGKPSPNPRGYGLNIADISPNDRVLADLCMEKLGFVTQDPFSAYKVVSTCKQSYHVNLPACQTDAIIPTPSVERRLNSWYCKLQTDYAYCLKHAVVPSACKQDNFKHPSPECQLSAQEFIPQKSTLAEKPISDSETNDYFEQNRFREQTNQLQMDMQNNSNRQMEKMIRDSAPKSRR